ncbi:CU044_5270 family protein [Dactylosporangium aurantiacum]|uniref:CU044_5270 family protein n=1 Tax=Dactylosporangium aurantiacum TaxID=35754 RepID=A0A9Q9IKE5_9ACTN|nr:CU044_5270 family protein [Dactylosporangium aurantiacum]MDG6107456.1 CU044_5270 family protein [Dactylosporangium aurantiacum]UWZ54420.1 CU044_5270 family protein [Dactylosporangium aurantiacum]
MEELDLVKGFRSDVSPADPTILAAARADLVRNARGVRRRPMRRPVPRLRWSLAATMGLALLLTGVLGVGALLGNRPTPGTVEPDTDAAGVLQLAAVAAQDKPALKARPDQYVFIESVTVGYTGIPNPSMRQIWLSVDGTRDGLLRQEFPGSGTKPGRPQTEPGRPEDVPLRGCRDGHFVDGGVARSCQPQPAFRTDLPTTTDVMFSWLYENSHGDNPRDVEAFNTVCELIREAYLPPAALSSLFSAASRIPGVTVDKDAQDASGRRGIGVKMSDGGAGHELVFDPRTYEYLGERLRGVHNEFSGAARIRLAIVDAAGQLP